MAKRSDILAGATDQTVDVWIQDSSSTTGGGKTGLVYNTASLVCYYRKGATGSATALTLATQTVGGAHSDGGFVEIDATNMPGLYRLDLSDTIVAAAGMVTIMLKGATGMAPVALELEIQPSTGKKADVVSWLGTAAATPTVAGVPEVDVTHIGGSAVSTTTAQLGVNVVQISGDATSADNLEAATDGTGYNVGNGSVVAASVTGAVGSVTGAVTVGTLNANVITAASLAADAGAEIADAVWDEALSGHTTAGTAGKALTDAGTAGDPWATALPGSYGAGTAGKALSDILDDTGTSGVVVATLGATAQGQVNAEVVDALTVDVIADAIPADGSRPTIAQAAYMLVQFMTERSVAGTTVTVKKADGTTALFTLTLDDAASPTSITRAT